LVSQPVAHNLVELSNHIITQHFEKKLKLVQ